MIHVGIISFGLILVVPRAHYERSWAVMMKDRIKKCNGQANRFFLGGAFSSRPEHSGSPGPGLPGALFRMKKAPLQGCELDTTLIPLLMRFPGHRRSRSKTRMTTPDAARFFLALVLLGSIFDFTELFSRPTAAAQHHIKAVEPLDHREIGPRDRRRQLAPQHRVPVGPREERVPAHGRAREPVLRLLREQARDEVARRVAEAALGVAAERQRHREDVQEHALGVGRAERRAPAQHLVQRDAERPPVERVGLPLVLHEHLRRDVLGRAAERLQPAAQLRGEPEVAHLSENRRGLRDNELLSNSKALGSDLRS